ncbi:unnamed protein product [Anisakis simplex]|uniref:Uncharacterized protein n=1 Tax=Anisakis simplex TaxID=6269 RepID=A0A3P6THT7_ANISI|nr:unnamed protein product [Anisakis simplex]
MLVPTSQRLSCDSAVSVFSSDDTNNENCPLSTVPKVRPSVFTLTNDQQEVNVGNVDASDSRHCSPPNTTNPRASVHKSSVSSVVSMEYDDLFELYSETEVRYDHCVTILLMRDEYGILSDDLDEMTL